MKLRVLALIGFIAVWFAPRSVRADDARDATFEWDSDKRKLYATVAFRDAVDDQIRERFSRGLPVTVAFTAALYRKGSSKAVATTAQTCKITWEVWEEYFRVEVARPGGTEVVKTVTVNGVLRRCLEVKDLLIATRSQVAVGSSVWIAAKVQLNPRSDEVLEKIKRWISRPASTSTASSGDALFSLFTGLFMQRIGQADAELDFSTKPQVPKVRPKPKPKKGDKK